jgi:6-pyruvoyl-tetrahydropterin synthase
MIEVARVYRFRGRHHVPGLAGPWGTPHSHVYTIDDERWGAAER